METATLNIFRDERPLGKEKMKDMIVSTLQKLHISCAWDCLETAKSTNDFIGICVLHKDGKKLLEDNRHRVKSGYIFVTRSSGLRKGVERTLHHQAYDMIFKKIEEDNDVVMVGFGQEAKLLRGRSFTFNKKMTTPLKHGDSKECLFIFRTLVFGAIIMYKLSGSRNIKPKVATLGVCLFLIIKNHLEEENLSDFPISDLELEHKEEFLKEMSACLGVDDRIIEIACGYQELDILTRRLKVKEAKELLVDNLKKEMLEEDFKQFIKGCSKILEMLEDESETFFKHVGKSTLVGGIVGGVGTDIIGAATSEALTGADGGPFGAVLGAAVTSGALTGAVAGPFGAVLGAAVGLSVGLFSYLIKRK